MWYRCGVMPERTHMTWKPRAGMYRILFVHVNGYVVEEHCQWVESVGAAADLITSTNWPSHAVVARAVDLDGSIVYEIRRSAIR